MADCYGCSKKGAVMYAGGFCPECRPGKLPDDRNPQGGARYMPNAPNERDAIVSYIDMVARRNELASVAPELRLVAQWIREGKHTA
jgi:hypothetical protein